MLVQQNHHNHAHKTKTVSVQNESRIEKTVIGTVYKFCIVCIIETIKIIGRTLHEVLTEPVKEEPSERPLSTKARKSPTRPSRTTSKVIRVNKRWLKQQSLRKESQQQPSDDSSNASSSSKLSRSKSQSWSNNRSFGRSLNRSRQYLARRHSYPPFRSNLEIVLEET